LSFLTTIGGWISEPPPERLFELTESAVAFASSQNPQARKLERLGEKSLTASPSTPNLIHPQFFREIVDRSAPVPSPRRNSAALVIPDYAVRMAVLDFEEFPSGEEERLALLRFRLRKSVPFHVEEARLAYSVQLHEPKRIEVLAVAIARPILVEYESVLAEAGYRVGLVLPSTVAALPLFMTPDNGLTLVMKAAGTTLSVLLLEAGRVRLARCLDLAAGEEVTDYSNESVLDLVQQTVAFAEDQIGARVSRILLCGFGARTETIGALAGSEFQVPYENVRSKFGPASAENAGLLGLLERYAA
jgi:type IV pilus assembly protein PilM